MAGLQSFAHFAQCVVVPARAIVSEAHKSGNAGRQRIEAARLLHGGDGFGVAVEDGEQVCVPLVRHGVIRIEPQRLLETALRLLPISVEAFADIAQDSVRGGQSGVQLERLFGGGACERIHFGSRAETVDPIITQVSAMPT